MRYIAELIRQSSETSSPGTSNTLIREYLNDRHAMRYMHQHLTSPWFDTGQYRVSAWPDGTFNNERVVGSLYKLTN